MLPSILVPLTLDGMVEELQLFKYAKVVRSPTEESFSLLVVHSDGLVPEGTNKISARGIGVLNSALEASNLGRCKNDLLVGGGRIRDNVEGFALQRMAALYSPNIGICKVNYMDPRPALAP